MLDPNKHLQPRVNRVWFTFQLKQKYKKCPLTNNLYFHVVKFCHLVAVRRLQAAKILPRVIQCKISDSETCRLVFHHSRSAIKRSCNVSSCFRIKLHVTLQDIFDENCNILARAALVLWRRLNSEFYMLHGSCRTT